MRFIATALVLVSLAACQSEPYADLVTKKSYARHGVAFDYPGNWVLSETAAGVKDGSALHALTVRTPTGAFVVIQSFEERMKLEVGAWADRLMKDYEQRFAALASSLEVGERVEVERRLFAETRKGLKQVFKVMDGDRHEAHNSAELFVAEFPGGTATVLLQASPVDLERGQAGFDMVLDSLKWTRPAPDRETPTIDIIAEPGANGEPDMSTARIV
ncbi:MAG: hypothetical protein QF464_08215, partial [Myxococcota bacterium]|nr:hypothetical protein [Myxococcota bacterium]